MDAGNPFSTERRHTAREREAALRRQSLRQSWPLLLLIPVLLGVLHACAYSLLVELFLGESFGLSGGNPRPWPGAIAVIFVVSFWANRLVGRLHLAPAMVQVLAFACWLVAYVGWILLEPAYRHTSVWSNPGQLVQSEAYLVPPLLISMAVWWVGMSYASDIANLSAEDLRTVVQRDGIVLFASILLAAMVEGEAGDKALAATRVVVPIQLIVSLALVSAAEVDATRRLVMSRGGQPPGWGNWLRLASGIAAGVLVLTLLVLAILSPGALDAIVGGMVTIVRVIGLMIGYLVLAVIWALFQLIIGFAGLIEYLFGDIFGPIAAPDMPAQRGIRWNTQTPIERETGQWEYAILLRWVVLGVLLAVVATIVFRFMRRPAMADDLNAVDEQRDSVFSADLAKQQLRDLFRRRHREHRPARLDLERAPASVRETMLYLETLADRQGAGRRLAETSDDFAARLRAVWPGVSAALVDFPRRYERVRYGEQDDGPGSDDLAPSLRDWDTIWKARKDVPPPELPEDAP